MSTANIKALRNFDINQLPQLLGHIQAQLDTVQKKVQEHDNLLERLDKLEQENQALKNDLLTKDLETSSKVPDYQIEPHPKQPAIATSNTYLNAAKLGAKRYDPNLTAKRRLAAGRLFKSPEAKGPQGYQYVYIGRSGKIQRSEIRSAFRKVVVDTGRVLDICFPASGVIGILLHVQYVDTFLACMKKCEAETIEQFEPLDPKHIADPQYDSLDSEEHESLIYEFTNTRALQTLSFLRPLNVSGVGKYFVSAGWISQEELDSAVSAAMGRFAEKEPKKATFLFKRRKTAADNNSSAMEL
ncbi:hypothetical protein BD408DRAFT_438564 [Parasitella parasitica]|nr:hypothetical protein BD408DRAFT_438564 [Parasitella parasitica]